MDQQGCQHQQKRRQQMLQHQQPHDQQHLPQQQPQQHHQSQRRQIWDMQDILHEQHCQYTDYFLDLDNFLYRQHFLDRQYFQHMQDFLDMLYSQYRQLHQQVQMASQPQPQPQSRPVYEFIPCLPYISHSQGYTTITYGTVLMQGNSNQEENRPPSDVHNERRCNSEAPDSDQDAVPNSVGQEGTARPVMANVLGTSTAVSCTSQGENSPIPDHQQDEAVNESRDVRISRQDVLKIHDALLKLKSMVKDLREENAKLKHSLSTKSQEEDIESYLQEIQQLVQNNLENPALDSSQDSVPNSIGRQG